MPSEDLIHERSIQTRQLEQHGRPLAPPRGLGLGLQIQGDQVFGRYHADDDSFYAPAPASGGPIVSGAVGALLRTQGAREPRGDGEAPFPRDGHEVFVFDAVAPAPRWE